MNSNDPIADMLTRIRNAALAHKSEAMIPFSHIKFEIAQILTQEGYIAAAKKIEEKGRPQIQVKLMYDKEKNHSMTSLRRVSKPGRRVYVGKENMPIVLNHLGIAILSTSKGLMTNKQAKRTGIGGEVICEVY